MPGGLKGYSGGNLRREAVPRPRSQAWRDRRAAGGAAARTAASRCTSRPRRGCRTGPLSESATLRSVAVSEGRHGRQAAGDPAAVAAARTQHVALVDKDGGYAWRRAAYEILHLALQLVDAHFGRHRGAPNLQRGSVPYVPARECVRCVLSSEQCTTVYYCAVVRSAPEASQAIWILNHFNTAPSVEAPSGLQERIDGLGRQCIARVIRTAQTSFAKMPGRAMMMMGHAPASARSLLTPACQPRHLAARACRRKLRVCASYASNGNGYGPIGAARYRAERPALVLVESSNDTNQSCLPQCRRRCADQGAP